MSAARGIGLLLICVGAAALAASSAHAVPPKEEWTIGVAPFERVAPEGIYVPDVSTLLADRLGATQGIAAIGPAAFGGAPDPEPDAERLRAWGEQTGSEVIVTGRASRFGRKTSIDVRVREAATGALVGTFVEEAPRTDAEALLETAARLAARVVAGLREGASEPSAPAVSARPEPPPIPEASESEGGGGLLGGDSDDPLQINASEIDAITQGGRRTIIFTGNVRASQGDLKLRSDRLQAFYPPGESEPERLVATGRVRVAQLERELLCDEATFFNADQRLLCVGEAELRERDDRVRGDEITIFLAEDRIQVRGNTRLDMNREGDS